MKTNKALLIILFVLVFLSGGIIATSWWAACKWERCSRYAMPADSEAIDCSLKSVFHRNFTCLAYQCGMIYHGKDTFEVLKFKLDTSDSSWCELSNQIYDIAYFIPLYGHVNNVGQRDIESSLIDIFEERESLDDKFYRDGITVYLTHVKEAERFYVYIEGSLVPSLMLTRIFDVIDKGE